MSCDSSSKQSPTPDITPAAEHAATTQGYNGFAGEGDDNALNGGGGELDLLPGQEAGPSQQQSLIDYGQHNICAWGPVIQQIVVPVAGTDPITVTRLSSPDPFTPTYQLPDGEIVTTNTPLPVLLAPGYTPVSPPEVAWVEPESGQTVHIYDGWILVDFKREATQAQIEQVIAANNLQVIMSWYEPDDEAGPGNSIAWFQFQYSQQQFADFGQAYAFFSAHSLVDIAMPDTTDELRTDYGQPLGTHVPWPTDMLFSATHANDFCSGIEVHRVDTLSSIPLGPEAGGTFSTQAVAVIDDGVYRSHKDFTQSLDDQQNSEYSLGIKGKISWIGVDVSGREIWIGTKQKLRGEPEVTDTGRSGKVKHGTAMAGIISAGTRNRLHWYNPNELGTGTAGLAPSALILPVRMKVTGVDTNGNSIFSGDSMVKAIRAIRFNFGHTKWVEKVRVVSISQSGPKTFPWPVGGTKTNISRDLRFNDRLYVAGAGNEGQRKLCYPAAHDNVLGVTGAIAHRQLNGGWRFSVHPNSNYWDLASPIENSAYAISGIFSFDNTPNTALYPQDEISGYQALPIPPGDGYPCDGAMYYVDDGGTSAATAQISALAFLLYDAKVRQTGNRLASSYISVRNRIVSTQYSNSDLILNGDPNHKLAGVASFTYALNNW